MDTSPSQIKQQPNQTSTVTHTQFNSLQIQQWPRLKKIRFELAKYSVKKSMIRVNKQKLFHESFDQIQVDELFDERVSQNVNYTEYSSHYADSSTITKGKFSSNGEFYGTVGSGGQGWVWNTKDPSDSKNFTEKLTQLKAQVKLCDIAFHPSIGNIPAFAPNICTSTSNGQLLFWTFDLSRSQQKSIKLKPHSDRINSVDFHPCGNFLLCSSYDMSWSFYDVMKLQQIFVQKGHQKQIHCASVHPDGSLYFTGDLGGYGQVWDLRTGKGVHQIMEPDSILCADFSNNGYELAVGGKSNIISIRDIRRLKTMKQIPAHTKLISGLKYDKDQSILCSVSHDNQLKLWHGRNYIPVNLQPHPHASKLTSVDIHKGKIATTTIQRKWVMWVLKNHSTKIQVKLQNVPEEGLGQDQSQEQGQGEI